MYIDKKSSIQMIVLLEEFFLFNLNIDNDKTENII